MFGINADRLLTDAGFVVEMIDGKNYPDKILPVVGPEEYDTNRLFVCRKG